MNKIPFLAKVAEYIKNFYINNPHELIVVLPNRRARLFLKKHLANTIDKPILSPAIYSIEDFIFEIANLKKIDNYELLFEFYGIYQKTEDKEKQSFEEFVSWASILLNDFNELDAYNVDTDSFFDYLNEERALTQWSPGSNELTDFQKQYLKFWKSLPTYYHHLKHYCLSEKKAYQGLAYRIAADKVANDLSEFESKKIIFAGFNALSGCEEQIINLLAKQNKADLLFDADEYFIEDSFKEAGRSLRKHIKNPYFINSHLQDFAWINQNFKEEKTITLIPCSYATAQPKIVAEILNKNFNPTESERWSLVLADESLLLPILNALPEKVENANISMGYPFKNSPLFEFIISYLALINTTRQYSDGYKILSKNLISFLSKPQLNSLLSKSLINKIKQGIIKENTLFIGEKDLYNFANNSELAPLIKIIFHPDERIINELISICHTIKANSANNPLQYSFSSETILFLEKLKQLETKSDLKFSPKQFTLMLKQIAGQISIPFIGEPLNGLQINGLLETRTLDFDNIIITSLNEGFLPTGKKLNSFIPFEFKREFGLPNFNDKDAIFSYHFYRLISRAKNVYLLYVENNDSERSRFIDQLLFEIPQYNKDIQIKIKSYNPPLPPSEDIYETSVIPKEPWVINLIKAKLQKGISPSSLNNLRDCSLRFFYSDIIKIKEDEELEDELDAASFGTILHQTLENIFKPSVGLTLDKNLIEQLFTQKEIELEKSFENVFGKKNKIIGKNAILFKVMLRLLENYKKQLLLEVSTKQFSIYQLEKELSHQIKLKDNLINLIGKADRIDTVAGVYRIIDYKTGRVEFKELNIQQIENFEDKNKAFQVMFYAYLLHKMQVQKTPIESGIVSFRNLSSGILKLRVNNNSLISSDLFVEFENYLNSLLGQLLNPDIPFQKTDDFKKCNYCPYCEMCNR